MSEGNARDEAEFWDPPMPEEDREAPPAPPAWDAAEDGASAGTPPPPFPEGDDEIVDDPEHGGSPPGVWIVGRARAAPCVPCLRAAVGPEGVEPVAVPTAVYRRRRAIVGEILATEKTYLGQLVTVVTLFVVPFRLHKEYGVTADECMALFSNIDTLKNLHTRLYHDLRERAAGVGDEDCLADIFFEHSRWIKLYKHYVNNYDTSAATLVALRKRNARVRKYLAEVEYSAQMGGLNLESLLVVPVQRIPRYVLLLQDLLKNTPETHADYVPLQGALRAIKGVADYINAHKAIANAERVVRDTEARIADAPFGIVAPGRELLREATLTANRERRRIFVFSDMLLIASADTRHGRHRYRGHVTLATAGVQREPELLQITLVSTEETLRLQLGTLPEYEDWGRFLEQACEGARGALLRTVFADVSQSSEGSRVFFEQQRTQYAAARKSVAERLAASEREYAADLQMIVDRFVAPLMAQLSQSPGMLAPSRARQMVANIEPLCDLHRVMAAELDDACRDWSPESSVAGIFAEHMADFRMYGHYVSHHAEQVAVLERELGTNPPFANWLVRSTDIKQFLDLKTWLEYPLRRISEYYLLLQEMENNTQQSDENFAALHQALIKIGILKNDLTRKSAASKQQTLTGTGPQTSPRIS